MCCNEKLAWNIIWNQCWSETSMQMMPIPKFHQLELHFRWFHSSSMQLEASCCSCSLANGNVSKANDCVISCKTLFIASSDTFPWKAILLDKSKLPHKDKAGPGEESKTLSESLEFEWHISLVQIAFVSTTAEGYPQTKQWVDYHHSIGVTHFYLFVDGIAATPEVWSSWRLQNMHKKLILQSEFEQFLERSYSSSKDSMTAVCKSKLQGMSDKEELQILGVYIQRISSVALCKGLHFLSVFIALFFFAPAQMQSIEKIDRIETFTCSKM